MTARFATKGFLMVGLLALFATGCADDEPGRTPIDPSMLEPVGDPSDGAGGGCADDVEVGGCEDGAIRTCKIQIDENNCFVGAQQCEFGIWGDCLDPEDLDDDVPAPEFEDEGEDEDEG